MSSAERNPKDAVHFLETALKIGGPEAVKLQALNGQQAVLHGDILPVKIEPPEGRDLLEKAGIKFGELVESDELFRRVFLPAGWRKQATDNPWLTMLIDDQDRERARIFYKGEAHDRQAALIITHRYGVHDECYGLVHLEDDEYLAYATDGGVVTDCGKTIFMTEVVELEGSRLERFRITKLVKQEVTDWLDANFPDWQDPLAYWD